MKKTILLLSVLLLSVVMLYSAQGAMLFLNLPVGAAASGLGSAYSARADGVYGMYWNPAGLGSLEKDNEVIFFHNSYFEDLSHTYLGYSRNIPELYGTLGISLNMFDHGSFRRTTLTGIAGDYNSSGRFSSNDYALGIAYSPETSYQVEFGAVINILKSKIDDASASGFSLDFGWRYDDYIMEIPYRAALSVKNIGGKVKYDRASEDLPLLFKTGFTMDYMLNDDWTFSPVIDIVRDQQIKETYLMSGIEASLNKMYYFRIGNDGMKDIGNSFTMGLGIKYMDFEFNYAWKDYGALSDAHLFELLYQF